MPSSGVDIHPPHGIRVGPLTPAFLSAAIACFTVPALQLSASLAVGIPVDLRDTITGLDDRNTALLITAIRHAAGRRPETSGYPACSPRSGTHPERGAPAVGSD